MLLNKTISSFVPNPIPDPLQKFMKNLFKFRNNYDESRICKAKAVGNLCAWKDNNGSKLYLFRETYLNFCRDWFGPCATTVWTTFCLFYSVKISLISALYFLHNHCHQGVKIARKVLSVYWKLTLGALLRLKNLLQEKEFQARVQEEKMKMFSDDDPSEEVWNLQW